MQILLTMYPHTYVKAIHTECLDYAYKISGYGLTKPLLYIAPTRNISWMIKQQPNAAGMHQTHLFEGAGLDMLI